MIYIFTFILEWSNWRKKKFLWPPSEIICVFVNSRAKTFLAPRSKKFYEGQSQIFFYKIQLLRWFLGISNVFLGYFGNYSAN